MNIKSRIKKMENQIIGLRSDFCDCEKETKFFVIEPSIDGEPEVLPAEDKLAPEFCAKCGKPEVEPFRFTFVVLPRNQNEY